MCTFVQKHKIWYIDTL